MNKLILIITGLVCAVTSVQAQSPPEIKPSQTGFVQSPVHWKCHAQKISDNRYDLIIQAFIQRGWHLYSQHQPKEAIAIPTAIKFKQTPSVSYLGKIKEIGTLEKDTIASLGISSFQYEGRVDFVQRIKLTEPHPDNIVGSITYQVCKDNECLPPETKEFGISIP